jgi:hypothetical protein
VRREFIQTNTAANPETNVTPHPTHSTGNSLRDSLRVWCPAGKSTCINPLGDAGRTSTGDTPRQAFHPGK